MRPAREGDIPVRVKNSYNPKAPGTLITKKRDMDKVCSRLIQACSQARTIFLSVRTLIFVSLLHRLC
jgi:aspartokinase